MRHIQTRSPMVFTLYFMPCRRLRQIQSPNEQIHFVNVLVHWRIA